MLVGTIAGTSQIPNFNASSIFDTYEVIVDNNIKN
jgi:hypothetical protein